MACRCLYYQCLYICPHVTHTRTQKRGWGSHLPFFLSLFSLLTSHPRPTCLFLVPGLPAFLTSPSSISPASSSHLPRLPFYSTASSLFSWIIRNERRRRRGSSFQGSRRSIWPTFKNLLYITSASAAPTLILYFWNGSEPRDPTRIVSGTSFYRSLIHGSLKTVAATRVS